MSVQARVTINGEVVHTTSAAEGGNDLQSILVNLAAVYAETNQFMTDKIGEEKSAGKGMSVLLA